MIARHTEAGREKAVFFPVDTAVAAAPMPDQVSPPRRPRGRPGAVAKPAENKVKEALKSTRSTPQISTREFQAVSERLYPPP